MTTNTIALPLPDDGPRPLRTTHHGRRGWLTFAAHFVEMLIAMFVGMGVLTALLGMSHESPIELQALYMGATMTAPMVGWMLVRGHSRRASAEMAAAMIVPLAALFPMHWAGIISGDALIDLQHVLMIPTMLGAMLLRRTEYGR
jgi:hypothetical protein